MNTTHQHLISNMGTPIVAPILEARGWHEFKLTRFWNRETSAHRRGDEADYTAAILAESLLYPREG